MIDWKDGAVCFAGSKYWFPSESDKGNLVSCRGIKVEFKHLIECQDFQLNEIREGDYIEASELDTEQKYNDAVEVFKLFGFEWDDSAYIHFEGFKQPLILRIGAFGIIQSAPRAKGILRKLTYPQLMAIGKLKRAMIERDNKTACRKPKVEFVEATGELKLTMVDRDETKGDLRSMFLNLRPAVDNGDFEGAGGISKGIMMSGMELNVRPINFKADTLSVTEVFKTNGTKPKESKRNKSKQAYDILKTLDYEYDLVKHRWYKKAYI